MKPHSISIVVLNWNGEDIHACLGSLRTDDSNPKVAIVDKGPANVPKSRGKGQPPHNAHVVKHMLNHDYDNHLGVKIST